LFEEEYQVPFLGPAAAAYLGTAVELTAPVFLALGLGGRWAAVVLFVFNIMAVISYPALEEAGVQQHQLWGLMLALICCYGPGKISFDHFIRKRCLGSQPQTP
jgi:putative oxidoreductase